MNPYEPSRNSPTSVAHKAPLKQNQIALLAFVPGAITGIFFGMAMSVGPEVAARRALGDGLARLLAVAGGVFLLSLAYRLLRRFTFGKHGIFWYSGFLSGVLHVSLASVTMATLHRLDLVNTGPPATMEYWGLSLLVIGACSVPSVEFEALASFFRNRKSVGE
ncbi:MAG: hypothetical protein AAGG48_23380 [Planctomycetota bacterium]